MNQRLSRSSTLKPWLIVMIVAVLATGVWTAAKSHAATWTVSIRDFSFQPAEITVHIGDTVTWVNNDSETHAIQGGPMNSPDLAPGDRFSFTFQQSGDVNYICRIHTYMSGVVHVVNENATTTTTAAPATTTTKPPASTTTTRPPGSTTSTTSPGGTTTTTQPG